MFKWTYNKRALELINCAYSKIGSAKLINVSDLYARALFSLCSHNFIPIDIGYKMFVKVMDKIKK